MIVVQDAVFDHERVEVDGKSFVCCAFRHCVLVYQGGQVAFDRTHLTGCRHIFFGKARRTLHYLQGVGLMEYTPSEWGEIPDQVH